MDRSWDLPENQATDKSALDNRHEGRRRLLRWAGGLGAGAVLAGAGWWLGREEFSDSPMLERSRANTAHLTLPTPVVHRTHVDDLALPEAPSTAQGRVGRYVNYYEFSTTKNFAWSRAQALPLDPWTIVVDGRVRAPVTLDRDDLSKRFGCEQRVYRHRCVEAWAMVVPWLGFPLQKLVELVDPLPGARYLRFESIDTRQRTGINPPLGFTWPYHEALTLAEATNPLAFIATGFYGEPLFKQNGAPARLVVPWKYGFKSIKAIARIHFTNTRPATFWNSAQPSEYDFFANVDPRVDHPRWSQKRETMIDTYERVNTQLYNGYSTWVAHLYQGNNPGS